MRGANENHATNAVKKPSQARWKARMCGAAKLQSTIFGAFSDSSMSGLLFCEASLATLRSKLTMLRIVMTPAIWGKCRKPTGED
jgi:hypothetical protein